MIYPFGLWISLEENKPTFFKKKIKHKTQQKTYFSKNEALKFKYQTMNSTPSMFDATFS